VDRATCARRGAAGRTHVSVGAKHASDGGGCGAPGLVDTEVVDSTPIRNVAVYDPSDQDMWDSGSPVVCANGMTTIHSSSHTPLVADARAPFTHDAGGSIEDTSDIKVLTADTYAI